MSMAQWLTLKSSTKVVRDRFLGGQSICFLFNSDVDNLLLKTNGGEDRRPNFVIFVVWSTLIVSGLGGGGVEQSFYKSFDSLSRVTPISLTDRSYYNVIKKPFMPYSFKVVKQIHLFKIAIRINPPKTASRKFLKKLRPGFSFILFQTH